MGFSGPQGGWKITVDPHFSRHPASKCVSTHPPQPGRGADHRFSILVPQYCGSKAWSAAVLNVLTSIEYLARLRQRKKISLAKDPTICSCEYRPMYSAFDPLL